MDVKQIFNELPNEYVFNEISGLYLGKFKMVKALNDFKAFRTFKVSNAHHNVLLLYCSYNVILDLPRAYPVIPRLDESKYIFIIINSPVSFGDVYIWPKTKAEQLLSFVFLLKTAGDIRNQLGRKYHFTSNGTHYEQSVYSAQFVKFLLNHSDISFEARGKQILIRKGLKPSSEIALSNLLKLAFDLTEIIYDHQPKYENK